MGRGHSWQTGCTFPRLPLWREAHPAPPLACEPRCLTPLNIPRLRAQSCLSTTQAVSPTGLGALGLWVGAVGLGRVAQTADQVLLREQGAMPICRIQPEVGPLCWKLQWVWSTWLQTVGAYPALQVFSRGTGNVLTSEFRWKLDYCAGNSSRCGPPGYQWWGGWSCPPSHPVASWGNKRLHLPAEFSQEQDFCAPLLVL